MGAPGAAAQAARVDVELECGAQRGGGARPSIAATACATASPTVAVTAAGSAAPARPASWAATAGQRGSRSPRVRSRQPRQAVRPGYTSGPTTPTPSRRRTARWATPLARSSSTIAGSGTSSARTSRSGRDRSGGGPRDGPGQQPPHGGLGGGQPLAAAVGVGVAGAEVRAAHRAAGVGVHGADPAVQEAGDDADGERAATAHADHTARPRPGRPFRDRGVDQRAGLDQPREQVPR